MKIKVYDAEMVEKLLKESKNTFILNALHNKSFEAYKIDFDKFEKDFRNSKLSKVMIGSQHTDLVYKAVRGYIESVDIDNPLYMYDLMFGADCDVEEVDSKELQGAGIVSIEMLPKGAIIQTDNSEIYWITCDYNGMDSMLYYNGDKEMLKNKRIEDIRVFKNVAYLSVYNFAQRLEMTFSEQVKLFKVIKHR